ncbi:MAG: multidrug effflux MFS transporter [Acidimicrobiia bacterium]|nr:multidrug effflux MFS transporter [Acidimicrobiia bacterium]MYB72739.1 multidrug effflux MFS transporter [Acidimicrobiia bacterium]MYH99834.1 multidrug effflux MFS transporter [Acidimicrobiia bacterium]
MADRLRRYEKSAGVSAPASTDTGRRLGEREFILFIAMISAVSALAIDTLLPAFSAMRDAFNLPEDSTGLSLTITLFFVGSGIGNLVYGPMADALGRKRILVGSMVLYGLASLMATLSVTLGMLYVSRFIWGFAAAGPRTAAQAIVRDYYSGDAMARVMTLVMAVFFWAPVAGPPLGKGLVELGSWRYVMAFSVFTAVALIAWSLRLEETLKPEHRRPLTFRSTMAGFRSVTTHPVTLGYTLASMFCAGAFFSFLASSELIFDDVFDQERWFVPYFSIMAAGMGIVTLLNNRALHRFRARSVALCAGGLQICAASTMLALALANGGRPPFVLWITIFSLANACMVAFFPLGQSLALEPMGEMAGTAAAVLGFTMMLIGASLAALIDQAISGTVTPVGIGYLAYGTAGMACQLIAVRHQHRRTPAA